MSRHDAWGAFFDSTATVEPLAAGRLSGMRFAAKDIFDIEGYTAGAGSPEWRSTHEAATRHAEPIARLLRQGAALAGTTQTDELMYSLNGENYHYGTPLNPKAPQHIPGGSSSGSAVAVAAGLVDFALGSDTGGSIRIPSSFCGIYGFRPTHGSIPSEGMVPLAPAFDTVGWMARDAGTMLRVGLALHDAAGAPKPGAAATHGASAPANAPGAPAPTTALGASPPADAPAPAHGFRRLLLAEDMLAAADPAYAAEVAKLARTAAEIMASSAPAASTEAGRASVSAEQHHAAAPMASAQAAAKAEDVITSVTVAKEGLERWLSCFRILQGVEIWQTHRDWIEQAKPRFGPGIAERFAWAASLRPGEAAPEAAFRELVRQRMAEWLGEDGIIIAPTAPEGPPLRNTSGPELDRMRLRMLQLCCVAGLAGLPQITLPLLQCNGLPAGVSFIAGPGRDLQLLAWAKTLTEQLG